MLFMKKKNKKTKSGGKISDRLLSFICHKNNKNMFLMLMMPIF